MLTMLSYISPRLKDIRYSIMVEYCVAQAKYYCKKNDLKNISYWSKLAAKYLLKRLELLDKNGASL